MSKYGGSEKTTQAFVAAYNKPRLSTRSTQAEAPAGVLLRLLLPNFPTPLSALWPLPGQRVMWGGGGGGTLGGKSPLDVTGPSLPHRSPRRVALLSSTTCRPNKSSSLCPLTPSPAQEQHAVLWCAPAPLPLLPFSAFLQPTTGTE